MKQTNFCSISNFVTFFQVLKYIFRIIEKNDIEIALKMYRNIINHEVNFITYHECSFYSCNITLSRQ